MATRSSWTAWAVCIALAGCSLSHDLEGLESGGEGGAGLGGAGGGDCVPQTCSDLSPACGDLDDGCGAPLACGCASPSTCEDGICECPVTPIETSGKLPTVSTGNSGNGAAWESVLGVKSSTDAGLSATVLLMPDQRTRNLQVRKFDFSEIPADATIDAVKLSVCRWKATNNGNVSIQDHSVQLIVAGTVGGPDKANEISWVFNRDVCEVFPYVWQVDGETVSLDVADVQDPFFGAQPIAKNPLDTGSDVPGKIDWMTMSVSYFESCDARSE